MVHVSIHVSVKTDIHIIMVLEIHVPPAVYYDTRAGHYLLIKIYFLF